MADLLEAIASLPPLAQALALVMLGLGGGGYLLWVFISRQRASLDAAKARPRSATLDALGYAFNDTQAMDRLREELRDIRAVAAEAATTAATNAARSNELMGDISRALHEVAEAIKALPPVPRRRR